MTVWDFSDLRLNFKIPQNLVEVDVDQAPPLLPGCSTLFNAAKMIHAVFEIHGFSYLYSMNSEHFMLSVQAIYVSVCYEVRSLEGSSFFIIRSPCQIFLSSLQAMGTPRISSSGDSCSIQECTAKIPISKPPYTSYELWFRNQFSREDL